jgi:hypothetical protein
MGEAQLHDRELSGLDGRAEHLVGVRRQDNAGRRRDGRGRADEDEGQNSPGGEGAAGTVAAVLAMLSGSAKWTIFGPSSELAVRSTR